MMTENYDNEKWVALYRSALLELQHALMAGRILEARTEIAARLEQLRNLPSLRAEEKRALEDALRALRMLEREEVRYAEQQRKLAESALEKLRVIEPKINQLKS